MEWLKNLGIAIGSVVVGVLLTFWYTKNDERIRYLDYETTSSLNILTNVSKLTDSVRVLINNTQVDNVSEMTIRLYNRTDKDYDNITIFVDLLTENSNVLSTNFYDQNNGKNIIGSGRKMNEKSIQFDYQVSVVNRNDTIPFLELKYLFSGSNIPGRSVTVMKKGLQVIKSERKDRDSTDSRATYYMAISILFIVLMTLVFYFLVKIFFNGVERTLRKKEKEFKNELIKRDEAITKLQQENDKLSQKPLDLLT